ncbi:acyl-CoA dehydrogenase family protein [Pseudomonas aeruginosa]|uniref:acyl-CoA dehydrogenase family protein n=1 Tax=Pseudomonas aeruginosa TaxID=287 RepID=UPI001F2311D2|nr:acyl-CoA dehydrogenase family protein [Pseudomonas aeruginosa]MDG4275165.1 acyl-CoA/acyl-ACP dehydrogenase [Pseudomonas aeruginosa]HBO3911633.1 acyl-CoA/acyl-ACP dehydrogenase [Pseudomonas aeruginosa]HCF5874556.1 acyl-CoA/acyl-ACP dehydrogenase [Pseudomonas aeruginosa]
MITLKPTLTLPAAGLSGFETPLTEEEAAIQASVHRFAKEVLRPLGRELDRMSAEQVVALGSPYYSVFSEFMKLGLDPALLAELPPELAVRIESMIGEELGWGDSGLAVSLGCAGMPSMMAAAAGNDELVELCQERIGCWMATQPDRGSDNQLLDIARDWPAGTPANIGNLTAKVAGDEIIINGQSSAWVSNGAVAQVAFGLMCADYGDGFYAKDGLPNGIAVIVPLDIKGVSKGKPLEKIGQRSLPQGEVYFDNVRVPRRFAIAEKDGYYGAVSSSWSYAGTHMSQVFTGVARAAFELALQYCHERRQGGRMLIDHQMTRLRLGEMLRRVEIARAVARRSLSFARLSPQTHPYATASAKVTVTEEALAVVQEAFRLFGGNGTTLEYPIEKLLRDTQSALIEDGENRILTMRLGLLAQQLFAEGWAQN